MAPNTKLIRPSLRNAPSALIQFTLPSAIINELWHDDFAFDMSLSTGWHIYNYKSLNESVYYNPDPNKLTLGLNGRQYHGPFTRVVGGSRSNYLRRQFQCNHSDPTLSNKIYIQYSFAYCKTDSSDYTRICVLNSNVSLTDLDSDVCSLGSHTIDNMNSSNSYSFGDSEFVLNAYAKTGCDITQWRRKNETIEMTEGNSVIPTHENFTITIKQTLNNGEYSIFYDFSVSCVDNETTLSPSMTPSNVPSIAPSNMPSLSPSNTPLIAPSTSPSNGPSQFPSLSPSVTPSNNPTKNPTQLPTHSPTYYPSLNPSDPPSLSPSNVPSVTPSVSPSNIPSVSPSAMPSNSPSTNTQTNNPSQTPTTQIPTNSPIHSPSINPSVSPIVSPSGSPITNSPSESPIVPPSASPVTTSEPSTDTPSTDTPTKHPITDSPTTHNPTTDAPTQTSTDNPTVSYTSTAVHTTVIDRDDIIFVRQTPKYGSIISNVYDRFVAMNEFYIKSALNLDTNCEECFEWTVNGLSIHDFYGSNTGAFAVYNHKIDTIIENGIEYDIFESYLIIHSVNDESGYHCSENTDQKHIFEAGNTYDLKLSVLDNHSEIVTNQPPFGGLCEIIDFETLKALDTFNLKCRRWDSDTNASLTYNAAFGNGVLLSNEFIPITKQISSLVPIGDFEINVLIKDSLDSITCYTMNGSFPSIDQILQDPNSNITAADLVNSIDSIVQNTNLGQNNDVTIALYSVINNIAMGNSSEMQMSALQDLTQNIITNVFNSSLIDYQNPQSNISKDMVSSELSVFTDMTSNPVLINAEVIDSFVDEYIPLLFNVFDTFIDNNAGNRRRILSEENDTNSISDTLVTFANKLQSVTTNIETATDVSVESNDQNDMLMEYSLRGVTVALSDSFPGETYYYNIPSNNDRNATKIISGIKFESIAGVNQSVKCGLDSENIIIPSIFASENEGIYDCSFVKSAVDNFVPINSSEYHSASNVIAINLYSNQDNAIPMEYGTDECNPYLISFVTNDTQILHTFQNYNFSLNEHTIFPKCNFWDNVLSTWSDEGCYVHNISFEESRVTCACVHLSTFQVSSSDFIPTTNVESIWQLRTFTIQNLLRYPSVFITMLSLFCVIVCSCACSTYHENDNTAILAFEDIVFKKVRDEKLRTSEIGNELDCLAKNLPNPKYLGYGLTTLARGAGAKKSLCKLSAGLYKIYLRNEHPLLSVFVKAEGTNYSAKERLGCFFLYLCTVMCGSAMVYGVDQANLIGDLSSSFWISLFATGPVLITKKLFLLSKPIVVPRTLEKVENDAKEEKRRQSFKLKKYRTAIDLATDAKLQRTVTTKLKMVDSIRVELFDDLYPLPHKMKHCAWVFLVIWTIFACFACLQIGLEFDLKYTTKDPAFGDCWQSNQQTSIETALSMQNFNDLQTDLDKRNSFSDNYNALLRIKGVSESVRWLISCFLSVILSLLIWQPITIYLVTWIKIAAFSWNLQMSIGPKTMVALLKRCCYCGNSDEKGLKEMLTPPINQSQLQSNTSSMVSNQSYKTANNSNVYAIFAQQNRPLDIIGYISNEELFAEHKQKNNVDTPIMVQNGTEDKKECSMSESVSLSFSENEDHVEMRSGMSTTLKPPTQMPVDRPQMLEMIPTQSHSQMLGIDNIKNLQNINGAYVEREVENNEQSDNGVDSMVIEQAFDVVNTDTIRSPPMSSPVSDNGHDIDMMPRQTTMKPFTENQLNAILEMDMGPQTDDKEPEISSMELVNDPSRASANSWTVNLDEMLDICADLADEMIDLDAKESPVSGN